MIDSCMFTTGVLVHSLCQDQCCQQRRCCWCSVCGCMVVTMLGFTGTYPLQRLLGGPSTFLCSSNPPVTCLPIHLEDEQTITCVDDHGTELGNLLEAADGQHTKLLAWFDFNASNSSHHHLRFAEFPKHFTWQDGTRKWQLRKKPSDMIGRMYMASPSD